MECNEVPKWNGMQVNQLIFSGSLSLMLTLDRSKIGWVYSVTWNINQIVTVISKLNAYYLITNAILVQRINGRMYVVFHPDLPFTCLTMGLSNFLSVIGQKRAIDNFCMKPPQMFALLPNPVWKSFHTSIQSRYMLDTTNFVWKAKVGCVKLLERPKLCLNGTHADLIWGVSWENLVFAYAKNKDADQLRGNCKADQRLPFCCLDSTIPLIPKSGISSLWPYSVIVQPGLCQNWSETRKTGFLTSWLICLQGSMRK